VAERVLITGGAGTLGRALATLLIDRGTDVRLADVATIADPPSGAEVVACDIRDPAQVERAVEDVDAVVHAAAWHGIHLRDHPPRDFWELNVDGTFNVFEAAATAGIDRAVLASTMGVYGESRRAADGAPAVCVHEDLPRLPGEIYGMSKVVAEDVAAYYDRGRDVRSVALRFGMFVPEPFVHTGIRFLYGGVDPRDVAAAVVAALDALRDRGRGQFTAFNIESRLPYDERDGLLLRSDPMAVIARHWPDAPPLLDRVGASPWGPINEWFDISKAERELNWHPRYGFDEFVGALRDGRHELS
jgi:nucleoside-diphosphate-sugar epimerase